MLLGLSGFSEMCLSDGYITNAVNDLATHLLRLAPVGNSNRKVQEHFAVPNGFGVLPLAKAA